MMIMVNRSVIFTNQFRDTKSLDYFLSSLSNSSFSKKANNVYYSTTFRVQFDNYTTPTETLYIKMKLHLT